MCGSPRMSPRNNDDSWICHFRCRESWDDHCSLRFETCFNTGIMEDVPANVQLRSVSYELAVSTVCAKHPVLFLFVDGAGRVPVERSVDQSVSAC